MKYYLKVSKSVLENSKDLFSDTYLLCESAFDNLYAKQGFQVFERLINQELVEDLQVFDEHGEEYAVGEFIEILEEYNFII